VKAWPEKVVTVGAPGSGVVGDVTPMGADGKSMVKSSWNTGKLNSHVRQKVPSGLTKA